MTGRSGLGSYTWGYLAYNNRNRGLFIQILFPQFSHICRRYCIRTEHPKDKTLIDWAVNIHGLLVHFESHTQTRVDSSPRSEISPQSDVPPDFYACKAVSSSGAKVPEPEIRIFDLRYLGAFAREAERPHGTKYIADILPTLISLGLLNFVSVGAWPPCLALPIVVWSYIATCKQLIRLVDEAIVGWGANPAMSWNWDMSGSLHEQGQRQDRLLI